KGKGSIKSLTLITGNAMAEPLSSGTQTTKASSLVHFQITVPPPNVIVDIVILVLIAP
ncbi:hypothetical protein U1Q18_027906, partial [Sarracenia purpurea var. burkii]